MNDSLNEFLDDYERTEGSGLDQLPEDDVTFEAPTGTWVDNLAPDERLLAEFDGERSRSGSVTRESIALDMAEYFANGGRTTVVPQGEVVDFQNLSSGRGGTEGEKRFLVTSDRANQDDHPMDRL